MSARNELIYILAVSIALIGCARADSTTQKPAVVLADPTITSISPIAITKPRGKRAPRVKQVLRRLSEAEAAEVLSIEPNVWANRQSLELGLEFSLHYLTGPDVVRDDQRLREAGIEPSRLLASVKRFRDLLSRSDSSEAFAAKLRQEFAVYKSIGYDGQGSVRFTGYFQPVYMASRVPTDEFRFPIFTRPKDFDVWTEPHPARWQLEGKRGLGIDGVLKGSELAYLPSRFEAFMIHLQGSAILEMPDGERMAVGFDGATNHKFVGFSKSWLAARNISWTKLREFFAQHPDDLDDYLLRNNRFVFFKSNDHPLPVGSLGVPVIAEHSIATDKAQLIPGGLSVLRTRFPYMQENGKLELLSQTRFVLDQDTGSAIKGPGRADVFMGTGAAAQAAANKLYETGELYYLLLK